MKRECTERQKRYAIFLQTEAWRTLSAAVITRDGECQGCGSLRRLQAHHVRYPARVEDTTLDDLRTLCRTCHRVEHGLPTRTPFEWAQAGIAWKLGYEVLVSEDEFVRLIWLAFGEKWFVQDAKGLVRLHYRMQLDDPCYRGDADWVRADELEERARAYASPEQFLGWGDLTLLMWETYRWNKGPKYDEHVVSVVQPAS